LNPFIMFSPSMIRALCALVVLANPIGASRIAHHKNTSPFFASCEDLQVTFRSRVTAVQALLDATDDTITTLVQARITMRVFGVVRTLRRAKECQWVLDGDTEDIEQARSVVQQVLARNPCAEVAMAELTTEAFESASNEFQPFQRAMIVLTSETCEIPEQEEDEAVAGVEDEAALERRLDEVTESTQDRIDELFEEAALEAESMAGGSLVQLDGGHLIWSAGRVIRTIGALLFGVLFALVCAPVGAAVGLVLSWILGVAVLGIDSLNVLILGVLAGGGLGFGACAVGLVNEMLPRDTPHSRSGEMRWSPTPHSPRDTRLSHSGEMHWWDTH